MMEFYATYWTYRDQMDFTEALLRHVAQEATGSAVLHYQGETIDLSEPFDRLTPVDAIRKYNPQYADADLTSVGYLRAELERLEADILIDAGLGSLQMTLFDETTEKKLIKPTFIIDYRRRFRLWRAPRTKTTTSPNGSRLFIAGRENGERVLGTERPGRSGRALPRAG